MKSKSDDRQAALQRENAELRRQLDESLAQQQAAAEVLQVISASTFDLDAVLQMVVSTAHRLCRADHSVIFRNRGGEYRWAAGHEMAAGVEEHERNAVIRPGQGTLIGRAALEGRAVQIEDAWIDPLYEAKDAAKVGGVHSMLGVPLMRDGEPTGAIGLARNRVEPFSEKEIALVENFAAQAVIAIENARLITETREALEQQTATAEVLGVINASPGDLGPVIDAILEKAHKLCGATIGNLQLREGDSTRAVALRGTPEPLAEALREPVQLSPDVPHWPLVGGEPFVQFVDVLANAGYTKFDNPIAQATHAAGVRTLLLVPLRKDGNYAGHIAFARQEVRPFTDKQIALVQNFAAQAVIAMENARLITETREALDQQTATAEVLQVINASPGELTPVFDAMLEKAMRLCEAQFGFLSTYDGEHFDAVALHGLPESYTEQYLTGPYLPGPNTTHDRLVRGELVVHVPDLAADMADSPRRRAVVDILGVRSILAVPLRKDDALLGAFHVYRREMRPFTDKQIALLQNFAAQAVIAIENARLITETRERTLDLQESLEYQTAISEVLKVISQSTFDLQPVLDTLVATARGLCNADMAMIYRRQGDAYRLAANLGFPAEYEAFARNLSLAASRASVTQRAALERRISHVPDIIADPEYALPEASQLGKARTALGVPLLREGEPVGVFTLARERVEPFTARQIELVRTFADQAVIAIENARLLGELRQRTEEVAELNRSLEARVAEQVDELGRVGRLKRFLAPQLAELIVSQGDEKILESHRREIVVVFCDLRGYTAFTETAEPEEVLDFLREYHGALGPLVAEFEGTLDQFSGDGIMVFFNDPVPIPDPAERAVKMAMAMREAAGALTAVWRRRGRELGFGAGIAQGYATLGQIGFSERSGYTAIGTVCNVAARLCGEAKDGQILIAQRVAAGLDGDIALEELGPLPLKGITQPVAAFNVAPDGAGPGRLRLVET